MSKLVVEVKVRAAAAISGGCAVFLGNEDKVFVYAWWPILRPRRIYENMSHMRVEVRRRDPV
jgi:hypothetical protein